LAGLPISYKPAVLAWLRNDLVRIYLGGDLNFYHPEKERWLEVAVERPALLKDVLDACGIPIAEIYLAAVDGEMVDLDEATVADDNEVRLFPPVGGGQECD